MAVNLIKNYLTKSSCYNSGSRITPDSMQLHTIGTAQNEAQALADYWNQPNIQACVHYCVDAVTAGKVLQFLPDNYRSWADAGYGNGHSITVELMESDYMKYGSGANFTVTDSAKFKQNIMTAYNTAVEFFAMKCKEYGWDPEEKMSNGLHRVFSHDEGRQLGLSSAHVDPTHVWGKFGLTMDQFRKDVKATMNGKKPDPKTEELYRVRKTWRDASSQLGAYTNLENAKNACPPGYKVFDSKGKVVYTNNETVTGTQYTEFKGLTEKQAAEKLLKLIHENDKSGILWSVTTAQSILESGYATTELSKANNLFGMKTILSGNQWANSTWDGKSKITIHTQEQDPEGNPHYEDDDFRKYPNIEDSIKDHSAYLLGAMNGDKKRYDGLTSCSNYKDAITIIKKGGYATDVKYVDKVCNIVERFNLARYDSEIKPQPKPVDPEPVEDEIYRVAQDYSNGVYIGQIGAFRILDNAKRQADFHMLNVYDSKGRKVYSCSKQYRVQCGSYSDINNARNMVKRMKEAGFDGTVVCYGAYVAQAGFFSDKDNAQKLYQSLKEKGLPAVVISC